MSDDVLEVMYFKHGSKEFFEELKESKIEYSKKSLFSPGTVVISGEIAEIITVLGGASLIPSIAAIILQWLKNNSTRTVMVTTKNEKVIHLKGYSSAEIEKIIKKVDRITIIQTKPEENKIQTIKSKAKNI